MLKTKLKIFIRLTMCDCGAEDQSWLIENCGFVNPFCVRNIFLLSMRTVPVSNIDWLWDNGVDDNDNGSGTRNEKTDSTHKWHKKHNSNSENWMRAANLFFHRRTGWKCPIANISPFEFKHTQKGICPTKKIHSKDYLYAASPGDWLMLVFFTLFFEPVSVPSHILSIEYLICCAAVRSALSNRILR